MAHKFFIIIFFIFLSCNNSQPNSITKIEKANIKSIFNNRLNLVYIWTTWCGVSGSILKNTYTYLQSDTNDFNIILLCGNNKSSEIEKKFNSLNLNYKKYVIGNASNTHSFFDRKNIKEFILQEFRNTNNLHLDGNYGIPLTFLVDSSLNILNSNMPQDTANIRLEINKYRLQN